MPITSIFQQEPRNPLWAGPVEAGLRALIDARPEALLPGLQVQKIECKTTLCNVEWSAPPESSRDAIAVLQILMPGAVMQVMPNEHRYVLGLAGGQGDWSEVAIGDPVASLDVATRLRRRLLTDIQQGNVPRVARNIPQAAWPKE